MDPVVVAAVFAGLTAFFVVYGWMAPLVAPPERDWTDPLRNTGLIDDGWTSSTSDPVRKQGVVEKWLMPFVRNFVPQTPMAAQLKAHQRDRITELLVRSGNPWKITPEEFMGLRLVSIALLGIPVLLMCAAGMLPFPPVVGLVIGGGIGFLIPKYLLQKAKAKRAKAAQHGLPEALDLLRITLNSGQNFVPALGSVGERIPPGLIRDELIRMYTDLRAGRSLQGAMSDLARRVPTPEVESFVRGVLQAERLGADVADTLRQQAQHARRDYEARLDKRIGALPNTLFVPILLMGLPSLLIVLLAPALAEIASTL